MSGLRMAGAAAGGLVAGLGLTVLLLAGERRGGAPNEIVGLERASARALGLDAPPNDAPASAAEQLFVQGGHLALSAIAGVAYAAATPEDTPVVPSGVAFGLAFYAAMHWVAGPLLGVKRPEWESGRATILMHAVNHVAFGLVTAGFARLATRSRQSRHS